MTAFLIILTIAIFYFLPALISGFRHHHNDGAIFALNLLLGWTILGWIVALIWSCTSPAPPVVVQSAPPPAPSPSVGFCPHCGAARATGPFCPGCGAKLG